MRRLAPGAWLAALLAALTIVAAPVRAPAAVRLLDHVQFQRADGTVLDPRDRGGWEVEIDEDIEVIWVDQAALAIALREQLPEAPPPPDLQEQLAAIRQIGVKLVQAQDLFAQAAQQRLVGDENAATETEDQAATLAIECLEAATSLEDRAPAAYAELNASMRRPIQERYAVAGRLLGESLASIARELARNARQFEVRMEAHVSEPGGVEEPVLVHGYYEPHDRGRYPFARFQTAIDDRTRRDLEAVDQAAAVVRPLLDDSARAAMRAELVALRDALVAACDRLRSMVVEPQLDQIEQQLQGLIASNPTVAQTMEDLRKLLRNARAVGQLASAMQPQTLSGLALLLDQFGHDLEALRTSLGELPAAMRDLVPRLQQVVTAGADSLGAELAAKLTELAATLPAAAPELTRLHANVDLLLTKLGIGASLDSGVSAAASLARQLTATADLSTTIEPTSARQRRAGDVMQVRAWIVPREAAPNSAPLASETWTLRLSVLGWYSEVRGALLFADPRSAGVTDGQDYEVAAGLGYHVRYGIKGAPFWNNVLAPGLGVSLALLDFKDARDFEVGIAGSATLLHDLLWAGYGRNLQAGCDYFYVGVNPMAVVGLGKRTGI